MGAFRTIMARTFRVHSSESQQDRFLTREKYDKRQSGSSVTLKMDDVTWRCELCGMLVKKKKKPPGEKCWVETKGHTGTFSASASALWPGIKFHLHWINLIANILYFSKSPPRAIFIGSTFNGINSPFVVNFDSFIQSQPV